MAYDATRSLTIALVAGEPSGDKLGADLIAAIRNRHQGVVAAVGIGGEAMEAEGLASLYDYSELSIVGISGVVARLPQLIRRIRQTADHIIAARPDVFVIIDSPDFTHRVAKRVRWALPDLPIIDYVCPSVWAWKSERATAMVDYIDHVLAILPFEPDVVASLGGPRTTYIGHRLTHDEGLLAAQAAQAARRAAPAAKQGRNCLLLPGSRRSELTRLLPVFAEAAAELATRNPAIRFVLPSVQKHRALVEAAVSAWPTEVEIVVGEAEKWQAFAEADGALAASGTVLLELALAGIPCVSAYKLDPLARLLVGKIVAWSAALPNLVAGYPVVPEYFNEAVRGVRLARHIGRLMEPTAERAAMLEGFDQVRREMHVEIPPSDHAARIVLDHVEGRLPIAPAS